MKKLLLFFLFPVFLFSGCCKKAAQPVQDLKMVEAELRALETAHRESIDKKDIDGILRFYATDMITILQGEPILYGRDWIRSTMGDLYKNYDFHEDFSLSDIRIMNDRVAASYKFKQNMTSLADGNKTVQTGKGMCIFKRSENGKWQFEWNAYSYDESQSEEVK